MLDPCLKVVDDLLGDAASLNGISAIKIRKKQQCIFRLFSVGTRI